MDFEVVEVPPHAALQLTYQSAKGSAGLPTQPSLVVRRHLAPPAFLTPVYKYTYSRHGSS